MFFPDKEWEECTPEAVGVDSARLEMALQYLEQKCKEKGDLEGVNQTVIVKNGKLIWKGVDIDTIHQLWSCTKSFTSTVLGILIDEGKCTLDTPVYTYLPELEKDYKGVSFRHLTTMTSGYNGVGYTYDLDGSENPFVPDSPLFEPGKKYQYWDDPMNVFGKALTRVAGESMYEVFRTRVADYIGLRNWSWGSWGKEAGVEVNGGSANHGKGIYMSAREFAKFGLLFLNEGNWNGRQLISRNWVRMASSVQVPNSIPNIVYATRTHLCGAGAYGFNWWVNGVNPEGKHLMPGAPEKTFYASGLNNNKCFVVPEWDMVVVRMGTYHHRLGEWVYGRFFQKISDAFLQ